MVAMQEEFMSEMIPQDGQPKEPLDTGVPVSEVKEALRLFDYDFLMLNIEAKFRACTLAANNETKKWEFIPIKNAKPFMNEQGIQDIMAIMRSSVSVLDAASVYNEDRILKSQEWTGIDLACLLGEKMHQYNLSPSKVDLVYDIVMNAIESNKRKSLGGRALTLALQGEKHIIQEQNINEPKQHRIFSLQI